MSADCPLARSERLITEELDGELLLYDSESNMAHALDAEAAALWRACDGRTDTDALAARCQTSEEDVRNILARLGELGLLEHTHADEDRDTRRDALRKIGIAGVGVATISSILVPAAAQAQSGACVQPGGCVGGYTDPLSPSQMCCTGHPISSSDCLFGALLCCIPAGACAMSERDLPPSAHTCCNGTATSDSSCRFTGLRCT